MSDTAVKNVNRIVNQIKKRAAGTGIEKYFLLEWATEDYVSIKITI